MKNVSKLFLPMLLVAFTLFCSQQMNAQVLSLPCTAAPVVGSTCVGACGPVGVINHTVGPLCTSAVVNLCLNTASSSLCPSHAAFAVVYVNGVIVAFGNVTSAGSTLSFSAPCGSNVRVVSRIRMVNPNINCFWLGEVDLNLHQQP